MYTRVSLGSDLEGCILKSRNIGRELGNETRRKFSLLCDTCGEPSGIVLDVLQTILRQF